MSTESDTENERENELASEAARLIEMARDKIIPLFPPNYKVLILARDPTSDERHKVFLTNEDPSDMYKILRDIKKVMGIANRLDEMEQAQKEGHVYLHGNDGTIN